LRHGQVAIVLGICLLSASLVPKVYPQVPYWIGLNLELRFDRAGTIFVVLNQHPVDAQGRSLMNNESIVKEVISEENATIETVILLFSATTEGVNYTVISHSQVDMSKSVYCNLGLSEGMKTFTGAITTSVEVKLNTTTSLTPISDDTYQVVVTDFYTAADPQSWIDAINFTFTDGVALLNYSSAPSWAKPPRTAGADYLSWVNENEADAPNFYVFTLKIPDVTFSRAPVKLEGKISEAKALSDGTALAVTVRNTGQSQGTFIVRMVDDKYDQSRKLSLSAGEEAGVQFPLYVTSGTVQVSLLADGSVIDQSDLSISPGLTSIEYEMIRFTGYGLLLVGCACLVLYLLDVSRHTRPQ